ncbi:cytochrome P450 [Gyrodon lividus]|nr:cytochrome P450 [Gyrodon lividus]
MKTGLSNHFQVMMELLYRSSAGFVLAALFVALFVVARISSKALAPKQLPLPPGPRGLPFVGSAFSINKREPWLTYREWKKSYGEIVSCRVFGEQYVILNSERVIKALVEQRSSIYSDRPVIRTTSLFGLDFNTAHLPYSGTWGAHQRMFCQTLNSRAIQQYHPLLVTKGRVLLQNLQDAPEGFIDHLRTLSASVIMAITFGYDVVPKNDRFAAPIDELISIAVLMTPERAALLNALPQLRYLPSWFPGAELQRLALRCRELSVKVGHAPFQFVKDCLSNDIKNRSMVAELLKQETTGDQDRASYEQDIKDCTASGFLAGFDSMHSALVAFVMAMVLHPHVQDRAHAELDRVVGQDRLPTFSDRASMPYIDAILRETLRWGSLVPLAAPHLAAKDDVFEGHRIPRGSLVILNLWGMAKDEDTFPDPEAFRPERYLNEEGDLVPGGPSSLFFGYGCMACPGRYLADASTWLASVFMLSTFKFGKAIGPAGYEIDVFPKFARGIAIRPRPFVCRITLRAEKSRELFE